MSGRSEFLRARIAEDEAWGCNGEGEDRTCWERSERLEREAAFKRAVLDFHESWPVLVETEPKFEQVDGDDITSMTFRMTKQIAWATEREYVKRFGSESPASPIIQAMLQVYVGHPDFDEGWLP